MSRLVSSCVRLFSLEHHDRTAFYTSPVLKNQAFFVMYRVMVAGIWGSFNVWSLLDALSEENWLWFAKGTHWAMTLLTAHLVFSAALTWRHLHENEHYDKPVQTVPEDDAKNSLRQRTAKNNRLKWYHKTTWVLSNMAGATSFCVTALYLTLIDTPRHFVGYMEHLVNSVVIVVDIALSGIPVKMSHFVYSNIVMSSFSVFTALYWALGGLGKNGETFLYKPLRYDEGYRMRTLCVHVVTLVVVAPLFHGLCCALCYLRSRIVMYIRLR